MEETKISVVCEYEFRRGSNVEQTIQRVNEVFGKDVASERTVHGWFEKFRSGDFNLQNESGMADVEKKGRGRPKAVDKTKEKEVEEVVSPTKKRNSSSLNEDTNGEVPAKRGRGRPPKSNKKPAPPKPKINRGRGRPPKGAKKKAAAAAAAAAASDEEEEEDEEAAESREEEEDDAESDE